MNIRIITALGIACLIASASLPRMIGLGTMITIDEPLWRDRSFTFIKAIAARNWSKTIPSIQPGVTTSWLGGVVSHHNNLRDSQMAIAVTSILLILIATYAASIIWTPLAGWMIGMTLALDPFFIAHGRVLHTDSLLSLFSICSVLFMVAAFNTRSAISSSLPIKRYIVASGVFAGLAILTKVFAAALLLIIFLYFTYELYKKPSSFKRIAATYIFWCAVIVGTMLAIWPALLTHPITTVQNIVEGILLYTGEGRDGETTNMWWYYLRVLLFRSTPAVGIMSILWIYLAITKGRKMSRDIALSGILLVGGVLYALLLSVKGERSDRYILFTFLTINICATIAYLHVIKSVFRGIPRPFFVTLIALPFIWMGFQDYAVHPYYLAYYNPFYKIEASHKLGWGEGLEQASAWIDSQDKTANVASFYPRVFSTFYSGTGTVESLSHIGENTKFIVLYRSMFERGELAPETDLLNEFLYSGKHTPSHTISINGLPYVWIFRDPSYSIN